MLERINQSVRDTARREQGSSRLPLAQLVPSPDQPRRYFNPQSLEEMAESMRSHGVLEPLLVRPLEEGRYEIIAGERRWRAAQLAGLEMVPVVIREVDARTARALGLVENLQRDDLNAYEETQAVLQLLSLTLEKNQAEVVALLHRMRDERRGKVPPNVGGNSTAVQVEETFTALGSLSWESFVKHRLPLLTLPQDLRAALEQGTIPYTAALALKRVGDARLRARLLAEVQAGLSLRDLKARIQEALRKDRAIQPAYTGSLKALQARVDRLPPEQKEKATVLLDQARSVLAELEHYLDKNPAKKTTS
jgi:ParB family chromosome partitioning protein